MILDPIALERRAQEFGSYMGEICRSAKIARSTFTRWKAGDNSPSLATIRALNEAVEKAAKRKRIA